MKTGKCKLCNEETKLTKHHLIPKTIYKRFKDNSDKFDKLILYVCRDCHDKIHHSFIDHIYGLARSNKEFNEFEAFKYVMIKEYLSKKKPNVLKEWRIFFKQLIKEEMEKVL